MAATSTGCVSCRSMSNLVGMAARSRHSDACLGDDMDTVFEQKYIMDVCSGRGFAIAPVLPKIVARTGCTRGHMQMQRKDVLYDPNQPGCAKLQENINRIGNLQRIVGNNSEPVEPKLCAMATHKCGRGQLREPPICTTGFSLPLAKRT